MHGRGLRVITLVDTVGTWVALALTRGWAVCVLLLAITWGLPAEVEGQDPSKRLEERYLKTLDDWVAHGGRFEDVQNTVVWSCGKLVMLTASAREQVGFMASQREEFDLRVDVCTKLTVNRVYQQPEFQKPEIVQLICDQSGVALYTTLCKRSGLR